MKSPHESESLSDVSTGSIVGSVEGPDVGLPLVDSVVGEVGSVLGPVDGSGGPLVVNGPVLLVVIAPVSVVSSPEVPSSMGDTTGPHALAIHIDPTIHRRIMR